MGYNLGSAAAATGKTKSTILKSIRAIDPAELHRVYPPVSEKPTSERQETGGELAKIRELETRIELMGDLLKQVEGERDNLREQNARLTALLPPPSAEAAPARGLLRWFKRS